MRELNDAALYERVQAKDKEALELLYDRYEKLLYSFSYRIVKDKGLSEEVIQEVFIKLWKGRAKYTEEKGKFSSWILTMTRHTAIDILRKQSREPDFELDERDALHSDEASVEDQVEWKERGIVLRAAVSKLKEEQKRIIEMFYFKGMTHKKISQEIDLPLGTVKGRIRLALKHLKSNLAEKGGVSDEK
ncbi:RNA polymerase sigma factor [Guptibacillus algicola]|uniref:RNA polymerase sigma factor n=1 Tax=Guptibacillus algicola TaxID=225844 RepID=UPI001CD1BDBD|nr:sigma-70 family RNA polymerase sigma factor [Alkalihalobacillus algicola]MCA0985902.1 sigma-70 family RNA polymerase sigma factor [Alkalihalobacillus algicola]